MATQFASLTPTVRFPDTRQPVRVTYSGGSSLSVIADALTAQPTPVVEATLEELSATDTPLRELVAERNALMAGMNADTSLGDEAGAHTCRRIHAIEQQIIAAEATTPDDAVMKLLTLVQIAPNHEIEEDEADNAIAAARQHFGVGYSPTLLDNAPLAMPQGYNPFMRGVWLEWQKAYGRWIDADRTANAFNDTVLTPAYARYIAVRDKYPKDFDFTADPEAQADLAAVGYLPQWDDQNNENWEYRFDAMLALLLAPAPGPSELAFKLKLFTTEEAYGLDEASEIAKRLTIDARRFGRHGAHLQTDHPLLTAFAGLQADATKWFAHGPYDDERDDAAYAQVAAHEAIVHQQRATTIEGVIVKLRVAFQHIVGADWSDRAVLDTSHPDFRAGLADAGGNHQMLWSAIEDLGRIAGIDLGEPINGPSPSEHTAWLNERNDLLDRADRSEAAVSDEALSRINRLDSTILGTPATSVDDVVAKLVMAVEVNAEGGNISTEDAAVLVREAKTHLGLGYVYSAEQVA